MSQQEFAQQRRRQEESIQAELPQTQGQAPTFALDSLLDEIDGVLETNASEFVQGFVQKGGQ